MAEEKPTLESLGATVAKLSKELSMQLKAVNHPEPSFAADGPVALPPTPDIQVPRLQLIETLMDMLHLATGPSEYIFQQSFELNHDPFVFDALSQLNFYGAVPVDGSASYADIAAHTRLPESIVRRILRYAMTNHMFAEETPGSDRVVHTSTTAYCVREPLVRSLIAHCMEDAKPSVTRGVDALNKFFVGTTIASEDVAHCAWPMGYEGGKERQIDCWAFLDQHEKPGLPKGYRAKRFAEAMQAITLTSAVGIDVVLESYDWEALGEATIVDLGGSAGHISVLLANKHPKLKLIVQDLPAAKAAFDANVPAELTPRVTFQAHDFFTQQDVSVEAYVVKSVFHDWPDRYVIEILHNLLPTMKPGARLIIVDILLPPDYDETGRPVAPLSIRKLLGAVDLQMLSLFNSKERKVEDWLDVVKRANERFELNNVHVVPGAPLGILEFILRK